MKKLLLVGLLAGITVGLAGDKGPKPGPVKAEQIADLTARVDSIEAQLLVHKLSLQAADNVFDGYDAIIKEMIQRINDLNGRLKNLELGKAEETAK